MNFYTHCLNYVHLKLLDKIKSKRAVISIIGLGYVGLPLSMAFLRKRFKVIGLDCDKTRLNSLRNGKCIEDASLNKYLLKYVKLGRFLLTSSYSYLKKADCIIICVPTPLRKTKNPDLSIIKSVLKQIFKYVKKNQLIILESTVFPTFTEIYIKKELEKKGFKIGENFFLSHSPERIDPGNLYFTINNTPKIIGGATSKCLKITQELYSNITQVIPVSNTQTAEFVKLVENTFRMVNIALANELKIMCDYLNINIYEALEAAASKPFGFMKFIPGIGVGGHCIPIDPHYLTYKLKLLGYDSKLINLASDINEFMPIYSVEKITEALNLKQIALKNSKILLLGITYKKDSSDLRESPALKIWELLEKKFAKVSFYDLSIEEYRGKKNASLCDLQTFDCVCILVKHSNLDYDYIKRHSKILLCLDS